MTALPTPQPIHISCQDLNLWADHKPVLATRIGNVFRKTKKTRKESTVLLQNVSFEVNPGELVGIIGASGSGKTSLLNVMSGRMSTNNLHKEGQVLYNGKPVSQINSAFVIQQDILIPTLTPRETFKYSFALTNKNSNLKKTHPGDDTFVESCLLQLGLKECADTRIGSEVRQGCSGGERRRTSVGIQMMKNPDVLFLDEPTTGLDAFVAFQMVEAVKRLKRTSVMTIHQPRSDIFFLCDKLILLSRGRVVFFGSTADALIHFANLGFPCSNQVNPADHLIDISSIDSRDEDLEIESSARVDALVDAWKAIKSHEIQVDRQPCSYSTSQLRKGPSSFRKSVVLVHRNLVTSFRDPLGITSALLEAIVIGVVLGWMYFKIPGSLTGIRSIQGYMWSVISLQGYLNLLFTVYRISQWDIKVYDRERLDGLYEPFTWLLSYRISHLLTEDVLIPLVLSSLTYFMAFPDISGMRFVRFFSLNLLNHFCCVTYALFCVSIFREFSDSAVLANMSFTVLTMSAGFFVQATTIPVWVRWTKYIAWTFWCWGGLAYNEFSDNFYDCPYPRDDPQCLPYTGEFILQSIGVTVNTYKNAAAILTGFIFFFTIFAYTVLSIHKVQLGQANKVVTKETTLVRVVSEIVPRTTEPIHVSVENLSLNVKSIFSRKKFKILDEISTNFEAGTVNVIMGPSGSGKSSLMHHLGRRLHSSPTSLYTSSGDVKYNGIKLDDQVIRSLTSFVVQDDEGLLPSLTVRETLRFAAQLRLPKSMTKEQKIRRAETVLLKLGLKACADTVIGSEFVKGISGGEKRRVSIAVQVLTDPKILLADEPTSGLDAWTASSLLDLLVELANEGRTVICTIHQSRSDMFSRFGNLLLLAKGGSVVYSGKANRMIEYFNSVGYKVPPLNNPADFALDLSSLDYQSSEKEAESRGRVNKLVQDWKKSEKQFANELPLSDVRTISQWESLRRELAPFVTVFPILLKRSIINFKRQPNAMISRIVQVAAFGLIMTIWFARLGNNYVDVQNRVGFVQEITALMFVGMLNNISVYVDERNVFYKEFEDRVYRVEPFFFSYMAIELPFEIITSFIFTLFLCIAGFPNTVGSYFLVSLEAFILVNSGESVGIAFNTLFDHSGFAVNGTAVVLSLLSLMAGVIALNMPSFFRGINYLSVMKYANGAVMVVSLRGLEFTCTEAERLTNGECPINTGDEVLKLYGLDINFRNFLIGMIVAAFVYRTLAYTLLKVKLTPWSIGGAIKMKKNQ